MYSIQQRRDISARIANPSNIPTYRRLLKASGNNYGGLINPDERKLAILLVSALLTTYSEEEIIAACQTPAKATETAKAGKSGPSASEAVKKNVQKLKSIPASIGKTWTILSSGLQTLSSRMRSIWAAGSARLKSASMTRKRTQSS